MVLDELGAYLATQSIGTVGTDLFLGSLQDTPDACVALREYPGYSPEHTLGRDFAWERPTIQVVARAAAGDYATARTKAEACYAALAFTEQTLSGVRYLRCEPQQGPFPIRRDENDRWEIGFNILVEKERSSS